MTYLDLIPHREDYVAWLKKWIEKEQASIFKRAKHSLHLKKLRHKDVNDEVEWYWRDRIWCQDVTVSTCPEEYCLGKFNETFEAAWDIEDRDQEWLNAAFDEAFREVVPEYLHEVLEG